MSIVVPMFPGEMQNNVYSSQMGHLPQTRVIVPPKASFNETRGLLGPLQGYG